MPPLSEIELEQIEQLKVDIYELLDSWGIDTSDSKLEGLIDKLSNRAIIALMSMRVSRFDRDSDEIIDLFNDMDSFISESEDDDD